jgi:hypothetical protein
MIYIVSLGTIVILISIYFIIFTDYKKQPNKCDQQNILPKNIKTDHFHISIKYKVIHNGNIQAILETVNYPNGIKRVIYIPPDFGVNATFGSFGETICIDRSNINLLLNDLNIVIQNTNSYIKRIEDNMNVININDALEEEIHYLDS